MSPNARGITATLSASLSFVISDTLIKLTAPHLPVGQILAIRGSILIVGLCLILHVTRRWHDLAYLTDRMVLRRSLLEALIAYLFISALGLMPLANLTAIFLTAPLMLTAASAFVLKEKVGWRRWSAVVAGFCGMLLVIKPAAEGFNLASLFGLAAAMLAVARDLTTRRIARATPSLIVTVAATLSVALLGLALYPLEAWKPPAAADLGRLAASAAALGTGSFSIIVAYRNAEASVLSPFRYGVIVLAILSGYLVWGDVPDGLALAGIAIIAAANIYIVHRERVRARRMAQNLAAAQPTDDRSSDRPSDDRSRQDKQ